jgi:hypothetical protein
MNSYGRAYRIFGFGSLALVDLIFSIALSYSMGLVGFILPTLMIAVADLLVECATASCAASAPERASR